VADMHVCKICLEEKPISSFPIRKTHRPGKPVSQCTACKVNLNRIYRETNKEKRELTERRSKLKHTYGITIEQYDRMFVLQGGKCAICFNKKPGGRTKRFFIDHCHKTQKIRGLLCMRCNTGLGLFLDNSEFLFNAISYLKVI
jgi:hypothetical protein